MNVTNSLVYLHPNVTTIWITIISSLDCCGHLLILSPAWLFLDNLLFYDLAIHSPSLSVWIKRPTASCTPGTLPLFSITKKSPQFTILRPFQLLTSTKLQNTLPPPFLKDFNSLLSHMQLFSVTLRMMLKNFLHPDLATPKTFICTSAAHARNN